MKSKSKKSDRKSVNKATNPPTRDLIALQTEAFRATHSTSAVGTHTSSSSTSQGEPLVPVFRLDKETVSFRIPARSGHRVVSCPSKPEPEVSRDVADASPAFIGNSDGGGVGSVPEAPRTPAAAKAPEAGKVPEVVKTPEAVKSPDIKRGYNGFCVDSSTPSTKITSKDDRPLTMGRCNAGVLTDPDWLGPCDPGSSVILEGIVWNESPNGLLVVNVTWKGKTYVGTLMDSTNHHWASPSFKESCLSGDNNNSTRDEDFEATSQECRRSRRCRSSHTATNTMATAAAAVASSCKGSVAARAKCRVPVLDTIDPHAAPAAAATAQPDCGDELIACPELRCHKRFKHENALRNHRIRVHKIAEELISNRAPVATNTAISPDDRKLSVVACQDMNAGKSSPVVTSCKRKAEEDEDEDGSVQAYRKPEEVKHSRTSKNGGNACEVTSACDQEDNSAAVKSVCPSTGTDSVPEVTQVVCVSRGPSESTTAAQTGFAKIFGSPSSPELPGTTPNFADFVMKRSVVSGQQGLPQPGDGCCNSSPKNSKTKTQVKKKAKGKSHAVQNHVEISTCSSRSLPQVNGQPPGVVSRSSWNGDRGSIYPRDLNNAKHQKIVTEPPSSVTPDAVPTAKDPGVASLCASQTDLKTSDGQFLVSSHLGSLGEGRLAEADQTQALGRPLCSVKSQNCNSDNFLSVAKTEDVAHRGSVLGSATSGTGATFRLRCFGTLTERQTQEVENSTGKVKSQHCFLGTGPSRVSSMIGQVSPLMETISQKTGDATASRNARAAITAQESPATSGTDSTCKEIRCGLGISEGQGHQTTIAHGHGSAPSENWSTLVFCSSTSLGTKVSPRDVTLSLTQSSCGGHGLPPGLPVNSSNNLQTTNASTSTTALPFSSISDCPVGSYCPSVQSSVSSTSLPHLLTKALLPTQCQASHPLEASTATEVFPCREDGPGNTASVGKILSNSSDSKSTRLTGQHQGICYYQEKKDKLASPLKPSSFGNKSILGSLFLHPAK